MSRQNMIVIALGGFAIASALPLAAARAQSGDALAQAENICLDYGVGPGSIAFDTCVNRAASAYDRGEPGTAAAEARRVSDAGQACLSYGIEPMTLGYRECLARETDRRAFRRYEVQYVPGNGFHYDAYGVLRDRNGDRVPPVYRP